MPFWKRWRVSVKESQESGEELRLWHSHRLLSLVQSSFHCLVPFLTFFRHLCHDDDCIGGYHLQLFQQDTLLFFLAQRCFHLSQPSWLRCREELRPESIKRLRAKPLFFDDDQQLLHASSVSYILMLIQAGIRLPGH